MTNYNTITEIDDATPEQRLVAALIVSAMRDARAGDPQALRWLHSEGQGYLELLTPSGLDVAVLQRRLLANVVQR